MEISDLTPFTTSTAMLKTSIQAMLNGALVPIHSFDVGFTDDTSKNCLFLRGLHLNFDIGIDCKLWKVWKCSVWLCDITKWSIGNRW